MIDTIWCFVALFISLGFICGMIAKDQLYYYERKWSAIGLILFTLAFVFGGTAMYMTHKVREDTNVVWDRCYTGI